MAMIRKNNLTQPADTQAVTLRYRNSIYQGGYKSIDQTLAQSGFIYFYPQQHLIGCKRFISSQLNGPSFFIYDSRNYQYGMWQKNIPCGVSIFRLDDTVIVASYQNGIIQTGSKILVVLDAYKIGVILELSFGGTWLIRQKSEIYCQEQIQRLLSRCNINTQQVYLSLLKFINNHLFLKSSPVKLRYIDGIFRFGFQNGLAVVFDQLEAIKQFQIFDDAGSKSVSPTKIGQVYNTSNTHQFTFKNKMLEDPSTPYMDSMKALINEGMLKSILSGFIKDANLLQRSRSFQSHSLSIKKINPKQQEKSISEASPLKSNSRNQSIVIGEPLSRSSEKKVQYLSSRFKQHKDAPESEQRQKAKRYIDQIDRINMLLSRPKDYIKPLNLFPSEIQTIKIVQQPKQIINVPIAEEDQSCEKTIKQVHTQQQKQQQQKILISPLKKEKKKIFQDTAKKDSAYEFSTPRKDLTHKLKIFNSTQNRTQKQVKQIPLKKQQNQRQSVQNQISSPINRLNSNAFSKELMTIKKLQQQPFLHHQSQPNINDHNIQLQGKAKKSLTEFESQSSRIVDEDMSNLQQLQLRTSPQVNSSPLKKLKKLNQIYKDKLHQVEQLKGKDYGNTPYLQNNNFKASMYNHNRKIINSMSTKSKSNRYPYL